MTVCGVALFDRNGGSAFSGRAALKHRTLGSKYAGIIIFVYLLPKKQDVNSVPGALLFEFLRNEFGTVVAADVSHSFLAI